MSIKCPKCQHENPETAAFCADCGTKLISVKGSEFTASMETQKEELAGGLYSPIDTRSSRSWVKEGWTESTGLVINSLRKKSLSSSLSQRLPLIKRPSTVFKNEIKLARKIIHRNVC